MINNLRKLLSLVAMVALIFLFFKEISWSQLAHGSKFPVQDRTMAITLTALYMLFALSPLPIFVIEALWLTTKSRKVSETSFYRLFRLNGDRELDIWSWILYRSGLLPLTAFALPSIWMTGWMKSHGLWTAQEVLREHSAIAFTLAFLLTSFLDFGLHIVWHRIPEFWELHKIHHSAEEMTILTQYREHPLIILLTNTIKGVLMFFVGIPPLIFVGVLLIKNLQVGLQHSRIDAHWGWIGHLLISPRAHHVHHARSAELYDRNFGFDITLWDRMFGTFHSGASIEGEIALGVLDADQAEKSPAQQKSRLLDVFTSLGHFYRKFKKRLTSGSSN